MTTTAGMRFSGTAPASQDDEGLHGRTPNQTRGRQLSTINFWGGVASMPAGSIMSMPLIK